MDAGEAMELRVAAGQALDRVSRDAIGHQRPAGVLLVDQVGLKMAIDLLAAEVDQPRHAEQPHRLEHVQRALDVDPHGRERERRPRPARRRLPPDGPPRRAARPGSRPPRAPIRRAPRPSVERLGNARRAPRAQGDAQIEPRDLVAARGQRGHGRKADEAAGPGDQDARHAQSPAGSSTSGLPNIGSLCGIGGSCQVPVDGRTDLGIDVDVEQARPAGRTACSSAPRSPPTGRP